MNEKANVLLNDLMAALDQKNFDLEVWKTRASLMLARLFGPNNEYAQLLASLNYDYSSWSLRDQSGSKVADRVKEQARGLIQAAIFDLSLSEDPTEKIIQQVLTGEQLAQIKLHLGNDDALKAFIAQLDQAVKDQLLLILFKNQRK